MNYSYLIDEDTDRTTVFHFINNHQLDASNNATDDDINAFREFYKDFGYFPTRNEHPTDTVGALDRKRIEEIRQVKN